MRKRASWNSARAQLKKSEIMKEELISIRQKLDALVRNKEARLYISGQHAFDEALIFGTTDAYLRLTSELVKFIIAAQNGEATETETNGVKVQTSGFISDVFDWRSEVILDNSDLVQTEEYARQLCEYFRKQQQQTISTLHFANYSNEKFQDCDFSDAEFIDCKTAGLKINGIALQDLLDCYEENASESAA